MTDVKQNVEGVKPLNRVIQIDESKIHNHLGTVVRQTMEETLNGQLETEADRLCKATRYERNPKRKDTRAGHYSRKLHTKAGEVDLKVPKLRTLPFETAIIERYKRWESSVEESLIEMYLAGVSVRRIEDITQALWGSRVSPSTVSGLNQKIYTKIDTWRNRPLEGVYLYVFLDGLYLKRCWGGEVRNVSILVAIGVDNELQRCFRHRRRRERGQGRVVGIPPQHERAGLEWSEPNHLRQMFGFGGLTGRVLSRSPVAEMFCPLLQKRFHRDSKRQDQRWSYLRERKCETYRTLSTLAMVVGATLWPRFFNAPWIRS